jgi:succinate dehydrogenase/fumarate reductase flavoprotein subunit
LIVVGASVGGLTAAVTAADRGCHVIVVERAKELGGGAAGTDEAIAAAGSRWQREAGLDDAPERLAADLLAAGVSAEHAELVHALAEQAAPLVEWLADRCGAAIRLVPAAGAAQQPARLHACAEHAGASVVAALARVVGRHHRIKVRLGAEVTGLLRDDAGVGGIAVKPDRRGTPTVAGRVLLACGGFAASDELVAEHCPAAAGLPVGGPALATGDGLRFALAAGVFSRSPRRLEQARREFRVGNLYLNRGITGALVARQPFGGSCLSGVGTKAGGADYLLSFMEPRVVTENTLRRGFTPDLL